MYVYLYDNFLKEKRYQGVVKAIETRLTDFGIAGKIIRLMNLTNAESIVEDEIKKGAATVVIVGDDGTFARVLSRAATCQVLYGFIPIGANNSIAQVLGIPEGEAACDVLARRRQMELVVCNLQPYRWQRRKGEDYVVHPQDGKLEAFLRPVVRRGLLRRDQFEEPSIFPFEEMVVSSKTPFVVEADGKSSKETRITIKLAKSRIEMVVGKERKF
ncbi:MAG: hypothetical protein UY92_C0002G0078 [Candidatus Magasanikbacteria bacterium GW2011_GWA2_56_11]|uniref:DAGKc domain-containing protein n=1 Tax=Candidatus Magasanikbacteria bacterium GW2011_GWA2_56_11 TaxID=1619044 RepID=A0A0G1YI86_9BACT|nr:MAG: hypothetical protein UY92_C0002G0078 [Candidatus Magasanikbacteria bacterium GW2011_GWA2_56_11]